MNTISIIGLRTILIAILIFTLAEKVCAIGGFGNMGPARPMPQINHIVRIPPRPPGWPQMWMAGQIIKSFNENKLINKSASTRKEDILFDVPAKTSEAIRFSVSLNERILEGCILEFDTKRDFEIIHDYYQDLNSEHKLHTWSIAKDNILVVIEGAMPEEVVQDYRYVLKGIDHQ